MKAGTTQKIRISLDVDLSHVDSIIFTLDGATRLTKMYPGEVEYSKSRFEIPLTQHETLTLSGEHGCHVFVETQINFKNKAVAKSELESFYAADTIATAFIEGNTPDDSENQDIALMIEGAVVYAGGGGTADYNSLNNKPQINEVELQGDVSLEEIGIDIYVSNYVEKHKLELKGEPGKLSADGKDLVHLGKK